MILKADFRCKQVTPEADDCVVEKVVELPTVEYDRFCRSMLERYPFIGEVAASLHYNDGMRHGFLVLGVGRNDGILVDPQGADYARYSAFIPNARSLLTPDMAIDRSYISPAEPWRDESRDEMLRMTLHVDGKPDYTLVLPADEDYLSAVKAYLDIDVFADAMLRDIRFKVPYIGELICDTDCPAVEDYNDFAEALEGIWQKDGMLLTYAAVLDAEKPETLRGALELLQNLDNYQRIVDTYGYGQQRLQETLGLDDEAVRELEGYMDFEKYGTDCMENDHVVETEFGRLRRLESPFPEQTQGQQMKNAQTSPSFRKRRKRKRCCAGSAAHRHLSGWNKVLPTCSTASQITRNAYSISAVLRQPHIPKRRRRWIMLWNSSPSTRITPRH